MKVLLISPVDPKNPTRYELLMGGENTYTQMLLTHPPQNVEFVDYIAARKSGWVSYHHSYYLLLFLQKLKVLPPGLRVIALEVHGKFDLVYVHGHPVKIVGKHIPQVLSDSSSNWVFLKYYLELPKWRLRVWMSLKKIIFSLIGVIDGEINTEKAGCFFVFSRWAKRIKESLGIYKCEVLYPGLVIPSTPNKRLQNHVKLLFVGVWFERKGGRILLDVYKELAQKYPSVSLTILGSVPADIQLKNYPRLRLYEYVRYEKLISMYKSHDILIHIPPFVEGYGMVVAEAMGCGMIPIVSRICALPEMVESGKSGLVIKPNSSKALKGALIKLLNDCALRQKLKYGAREKFLKQFALPRFQKQLLALFNLVLLKRSS